MSARAVIIGAARSGSGKTSVAIGLMRAMRRRGLAVAGGKSGPDYIDPAFHEAATGLPGVNLDSWAMPPSLIANLLHGQCDGTDLLVIESAMGLFDGVHHNEGRTGAAADLARLFEIPVIVVMDLSGQSQTAAAIAHGFATFDPRVRVVGVVLNQVASDRHESQAREAIEKRGIRVLGSIRRNPEMTLPERHLGLVQAREHAALEAYIDKLADVIEASVDLDAVLELSGGAMPVTSERGAILPPGQRIAIADDAAFAFLYPHHGRLWREAGAELVSFSPLAGEAPNPSCDACWLPGGYPELHGARLATQTAFHEGLRRFAQTRPVHGECGGFMVLGAAIEDADGITHQMTGLLSHVTSYAKRRINLGYRRARLLADCALGDAGQTVRGHEFHYSQVAVAGDDAPLAEIADAAGRDLRQTGARRGHVTGAFFHAIAVEPADG